MLSNDDIFKMHKYTSIISLGLGIVEDEMLCATCSNIPITDTYLVACSLVALGLSNASFARFNPSFTGVDNKEKSVDDWTRLMIHVVAMVRHSNLWRLKI